MQNRMTSRKRSDSGVDTGKPRQGNTIPAQGETQDKVPRMPHERDESSDSQARQEPSGQRMANQGREDIERGLVDTDKGPPLDATYDKLREGADDPVKKFSP
jgi:hypothetical protein